MGGFFLVQAGQPVQFQRVVRLLRLIHDFARLFLFFSRHFVALGVKKGRYSAQVLTEASDHNLLKHCHFFALWFLELCGAEVEDLFFLGCSLGNEKVIFDYFYELKAQRVHLLHGFGLQIVLRAEFSYPRLLASLVVSTLVDEVEIGDHEIDVFKAVAAIALPLSARLPRLFDAVVVGLPLKTFSFLRDSLLVD